MSLTVGSLFSGIGGLDLGLEWAGMRVVWQVENDPFCISDLERHWPDVERHRDIRQLDPADLLAVDLICGGFPCQPISVAGRQKFGADDRWLWPEMRRVCEVVRPRWVLVENVRGLLSADSGRLFGGVVRDLAALGYFVEWDCVPASAVGAPHIRDRVFVIGRRDAVADSNRHDEPQVSAGDGALNRQRPQERRGQSSPPGLEQAVELASGVIPKELDGMTPGTLPTHVKRYWPTPNSADSHRGADDRDRPGSGGPNLLHAVRQWPTPTSRDWKDGKRSTAMKVPESCLLGRAVHYRTIESQEGSGSLNPTWVEWLMGFPLGWTDSSHSETPSCHPSQRSLES